MTVEELYEKLSSPAFQDTENGDLFYNFYIFQYPAKDEYDIRQQIKSFKENLKRPTSYVDVLTLDMFREFLAFLDGQSFGEECDSLKKFFMQEESDPEIAAGIQEVIAEQANSDDFYSYIHNKIMSHIAIDDDMKRPYVFLYGWGDMFPYLRTNTFLTNYEKFNRPNKYKVIVFYPGHRVGNSFSLFDRMEDSHTYRATLLLNDYNQ